MTDFKVVIPDYADEYDTFLEYFDKQIKSSRLKRVDKIGLMEWDLSGGILSKGRVNIFRSSSNIICMIKSEIDVFPIVLILAFLSILIGLILLAIALSNQGKIDREVRRVIEEAKAKISTKVKTKYPSTLYVDKEKIMDCPECGKALYDESNFCPYCGFKLVKCIVCKKS